MRWGFYNEVEERVRRCLQEMAGAGVRQLVLWGASDAARIVMDLVESSEIQVVGVLDDMYMDTSFNGAPVLRAAELSGCVWDGVLITALDELEAVEAQLRDRGLVEEQIWRLA